jgi:predicted RND superfamily exporter protein
MFLRGALPEHHLSTDSKDIIRVGMGVIGTMAALVLALLIAAAQGSFREQRSEIVQLSANIILLDRVFAHYGPETKEARDLLRRVVATTLKQMWPEDSSQPAQLDPTASEAEVLLDKVQALSPQNETQRSLHAQALSLAFNLVQTRWLMFVQQVRSIPVAFLIVLAVLVFWFTTIFFSVGLFAPFNATVIAILFISALSISGAIFLIVDLNRPFEGLLRIPSAPLRDALEHLGQ